MVRSQASKSECSDQSVMDAKINLAGLKELGAIAEEDY
jgi:hypothetical protein